MIYYDRYFSAPLPLLGGGSNSFGNSSYYCCWCVCVISAYRDSTLRDHLAVQPFLSCSESLKKDVSGFRPFPVPEAVKDQEEDFSPSA